LAVILIDYDNLLRDLPGENGEAGQLALAMISRLRQYLSSGLGVDPVRAIAFGDFGDTGPSGTIDELALVAVETCHVPSGIQPSDSETALIIKATELVAERHIFSTFVLLSGSSWFVPLIRSLRQAGKQVIAAILNPPSQHHVQGQSDAFLDATVLLPADTKLLGDASDHAEPETETGFARPHEFTSIGDSGALSTLELIHEYFGQYEEVYLTPLLRRMTETLFAEDGEPKDLVTILQDAGAVWLEKRRGFPHDYTVLMVNEKHPDVIRVREAVRSPREEHENDADLPGSESEY